eukprot:GEMP01039824.1.p1 GENE.GEMP01039824.1~~GEMP01039824.1.p1  ORF type:complete len:226 (+),score=62.07 GEMP01039824.1:775-1452(+)
MEACRMLLAAGAHVEGLCGGFTYLTRAAGNGHLDLCRLFVAAERSILGTSQAISLEIVAGCSGNAQVFKLLLTLGAVQAVRTLSSEERALRLAAASRPAPGRNWYEPDPSLPVDLSQVLFSPDCDLAHCDEDDRILLAQVVRTLINRRSDIDIGPNTLISMAAQEGYLDVCRVCMAAGADVNFRNRLGDVPMDFAATDDVRKLLLSAGAEPVDDEYHACCQETIF